MHETMGSYPDLPADYVDEYHHGRGRHRSPVADFSYPLVPPDSGWDPAEELAYMLRDSMEQQTRFPGARNEEPPLPPEAMTPREALVELTAELPPVKAAPRGHRKERKKQRSGRIRVVSYLIAAAVTVIASGVSIFGGLIAYDPLRFVAAARTESTVVSWWPLLVFGPWLVASLSILRAALHQRRAFHSWSVLLVFSAIAMALCVAQAPKNIVDTVAAALPSLASLACFQQVVRQVTLTRPPRRTFPRHRSQPAEKTAAEEIVAAPEGTPYPSGDQPREDFPGEAVAGGPVHHDPLSGQPRRFGWPGDRP